MTTTRPARPLAVVTGASSGLGLEIARRLAALGWDLLITARSAATLEEVRRTFEGEHGVAVTVSVNDLATERGIAGLLADVAALGRPVDMVVANAGFGLYGPYLDTDPDEEAAMLRLNMAAPVALVRGVLPAMVERGSGRLLIVGSVGGFFPGPWTTTYYATRAFIVSYAEALAEELARTGVTVTCLCPGPMPTGFQERAGIRPESAQFGALSPARVAHQGVAGTLAGRRRVVPGLVMRATLLLSRFLPRTLFVRLVGAIQARRG